MTRLSESVAKYNAVSRTRKTSATSYCRAGDQTLCDIITTWTYLLKARLYSSSSLCALLSSRMLHTQYGGVYEKKTKVAMVRNLKLRGVPEVRLWTGLEFLFHHIYIRFPKWKKSSVVKRWRSYILPQYHCDLTQLIRHKKARKLSFV